MNKKYRITAVLLIICLCISLIPESVCAQEPEEVSLENAAEKKQDEKDVSETEDSEEVKEPERPQEPEKLQGSDEAGEVSGGDAAEDVTSDSESSDDKALDAQSGGEVIEPEVTVEDEDPGKGRLRGDVPEEFYGPDGGIRAKATGLQHNSKFAGYNIIEGIDVSKYNGTINWTAVKNSGIDFAFVRTSYRGYGTGKLANDAYAPANMKNAAAAGVRIGAYIFSQAITVEEAQQEADYLLNSVKGYNITMPLVFDFEYFEGGRLAKAKLTNRKRTDICLAFCERIKAAGYTPLVYANKSMLTNDLYASEISSKYLIWLAHYTSASNYTGDYTFWQYTENGKVSGISGVVDKNVWYAKPGEDSMSFGTPGASAVVTTPDVTELSGKASSYDKVKLTWKKIPEATGYAVYRYNSSKGAYEKIKTISSANTVSYTDTGRTMGTTYKYRVKVYKKTESGTVYSKASNTVSVKTDSTMTGKTNATSVVVRKGPSTLKGKLTTLKINTGVTITGISGSWYKISIKTGGKKKTGYIKKSYVTIIRKPTLSVKAAAPDKIKLTWDKISGASGYEIQRYNPSTGKYVKIKTIKKGSTVSYTNSGLTSGLTYKYKMRSYKTVKGKKIYSYYCPAKSAKTN